MIARKKIQPGSFKALADMVRHKREQATQPKGKANHE